MKKTLLILAVIFICLMPVTALADSPAPPPFCVLIDDYSNSGGVQVFGYDNSGNRSEIKIVLSEVTKVISERALFFINDGGKFVSIQVQAGIYSAPSNTVYIKDSGSYIYSLKDNALKKGEITTWKPNTFSVILVAIVLIFPMLFSVLVEWIVSLFFKLKPDKYVIIINFITNPVINILLLICVNFAIDYIFLLVILEILVAGVEFWFYTWKYKGYSKIRLLIFTLVANAASWGLYWLLIPLL